MNESREVTASQQYVVGGFVLSAIHSPPNSRSLIHLLPTGRVGNVPTVVGLDEYDRDINKLDLQWAKPQFSGKIIYFSSGR